MSAMDPVGAQLALTMRTSWLSEFRNPAGVLLTFEIAGHLTSFGMLCALISQVPGVEFADLKPPARFVGPARFRFKGLDHEVSIAHLDYRIGALDAAAAAAQTEELLGHLRDPLSRRARNFARKPS
jgi:hypothetical protein